MSGADRYTSARAPYARARGAPPVMDGTYTGDELKTRSARPGAYDALGLPSRMGDYLIHPPEDAAAAAAGEPHAHD